MLSTLLKALHFIIPDIKTFDANKMEIICVELQKYLYLGTSFFQIQPISSFNKIYITNSLDNGNNNIISSSSDFSDIEEIRDK